MATQTELFLVRHGEPMLQGALLGSTDSPLSQNGWQQLNDALDGLDKIEYITSSPLSRCAHYAQDYAEQANLPLEVNSDWRECHFGDWDGERYEVLHQKYPQEVSAFISDPANNTPPNGETLRDFSLRIERALLKLHQDFQGSNVLLLTHAGVIRTIIAWCLQIDYLSGGQFRRFAIDYASITHLSIYQEDKLYPQLISLNWKLNTPQPVPSLIDIQQ